MRLDAWVLITLVLLVLALVLVFVDHQADATIVALCAIASSIMGHKST